MSSIRLMVWPAHECSALGMVLKDVTVSNSSAAITHRMNFSPFKSSQK